MGTGSSRGERNTLEAICSAQGNVKTSSEKIMELLEEMKVITGLYGDIHKLILEFCKPPEIFDMVDHDWSLWLSDENSLRLALDQKGRLTIRHEDGNTIRFRIPCNQSDFTDDLVVCKIP